jgi:hypothetical protein
MSHINNFDEYCNNDCEYACEIHNLEPKCFGCIRHTKNLQKCDECNTYYCENDTCNSGYESGYCLANCYNKGCNNKVCARSCYEEWTKCEICKNRHCDVCYNNGKIIVCEGCNTS